MYALPQIGKPVYTSNSSFYLLTRASFYLLASANRYQLARTRVALLQGLTLCHGPQIWDRLQHGINYIATSFAD